LCLVLSCNILWLSGCACLVMSCFVFSCPVLLSVVLSFVSSCIFPLYAHALVRLRRPASPADVEDNITALALSYASIAFQVRLVVYCLALRFCLCILLVVLSLSYLYIQSSRHSLLSLGGCLVLSCLVVWIYFCAFFLVRARVCMHLCLVCINESMASSLPLTSQP
jgi:hypothetical protein